MLLLFALLSCTEPPGTGMEDSAGHTGDSASDSAGQDTQDSAGHTGDTADTATPIATPCITDGLDGGFVTREGDQLVLDGEPFRFVSFNIPNLHILEDPDWHLPDPWEQADAMCTIQQLGGRVARTYVLSVGDSGKDLPRHVTAPGEFSEDLFVALDHAVAEAAKHGVRLVLPFVDQWWWWGGIADYAGFRGLDEASFWTDEQVMADFEETIRFLVERENTVTGVVYRDDPAILAWETGNELDAPTEWTERIVAFIKGLDSNHLVVDGHYGIDPESLDNPDVDIVSDHYYWPPAYWDDYAAAASDGQALAAGHRPFIVGEFGLVELDRVADLLDTVVAEGVTGAMIWSLRHHRSQGGFYWHTEVDDGTSLYRAYHWPGFDSGDAYNERQVLALHRQAAWAIQGLEPPELLPPDPPTLLSVDDPQAIRWQGSTGAGHYSLERAPEEEGPWTEVQSGFDDATEAHNAQVADPDPPLGETVWYRMVAHSNAGASLPSDPAGPVTISTQVSWTDSLSTMDTLEASENLVLDDTNVELFDGDASRLTRSGSGDGWATWLLAGTLVSAEVVVYHWPWEDRGTVVLEGSTDGTSWESLPTLEDDQGGDWERTVLSTTRVPTGTTLLRVTFQDHGGKVWNPQVSEVTLSWQ